MADELTERRTGIFRESFHDEQSSSFSWKMSLLWIPTEECIISPLFNGMNNTWQLRFYRITKYKSLLSPNDPIGLELLRLRPSKRPVTFTIRISNSGKECIVALSTEFDVQSDSFNTTTEIRWGSLSCVDYMIVRCVIWTEELHSKRGITTLWHQAAINQSTKSRPAIRGNATDEGSRRNVNIGSVVDSKLHKHLKDLRLTGYGHDVIINVRNQEFRAHKNILCVRSPIFAAMFKHEMKENEANCISIDDCNPEAFDEFLNYVYTGKVENMSPKKATGVYYAGDKYDFSELKELCVQFLESSLSITSICDVIDLARRHGENGLLESAIKFFSENIEQILPTVEWQRFGAKNFVVANELIMKAIKTFQDKNI